MMKKCLILFLSVGLLSLFSTVAIAEAVKDDLSVKIDKYTYPKSIWLDEPIMATCTYKFELKGATKLPPHKNFSLSVGFLFAVEMDVVTGGASQYVVTNPAEIPSYPESTGPTIKRVIRIDVPKGTKPNEVISGSFQLVYYPRTEGMYKLICKAYNNELDQSNLENDRDETQKFQVYGASPLTTQDIPVPTILKPGRKVISISPYTQSIDLEGMIDPKEVSESGYWVFPESHSIVFEEKWNFKLEKRIRTVGKQFETIESYSGLFKNQSSNAPIYFKTKITQDTLDKMGAGEYRLISWLSQEKTPTGTTKGLTTTFNFTVVREDHQQLNDDIVIEKSDKNDSIVIPSRPLENKNQQSTSTNKNQNLKVYMPKAVLEDKQNDAVYQGNIAVKQKDIFHGTNLFGMDYRHFTTEKWNVCNDACNKDNKCSSWTWVKPGIKGPEGFCFLKNGIPDKSLNDCCVSGIKHQSIK